MCPSMRFLTADLGQKASDQTIPEIDMGEKLKVESILRITKPDGSVIEVSGESPETIPAPEDFDLATREGFLRDFDALEKGIISARKQAEGKLAAEFLADSSKKNASPHAGKTQP